VGPTRSRYAIPVAGAAENARIPMITAGSTHPDTTAGKDYVFRTVFVDSLQGRVLARFALEELRIPTVAVLYDVANDYNRHIAEVFKEVFEATGGQVVAFETYVTGDRDFRRQLVRIRESRAELLFLPNFEDDVVAQAQQARRLGFDALFLGSDAWGSVKIVHHPELEGAFVSGHWLPDPAETNAEARAFIAAYRRAYDQDPTDAAALTYDALGLLFQAIREAGRADPEPIREALSRLESYPGTTGTITYRGTDGDPRKQILMIRIREGKAVVYKRLNPRN